MSFILEVHTYALLGEIYLYVDNHASIVGFWDRPITMNSDRQTYICVGLPII